MAQRLDFASEAFFRDPVSVVAALRAEAPVVEARFPIVGRVWVTTTHEATARVLKDSASFSLRENGAVASLRWWMPASVA
jgi:cytochrome P450